MKKIKNMLCSIVSLMLCFIMLLSGGTLNVLAAVNDRAAPETSEETVTYLSDLDWEWAYASARDTMYGDKENASGREPKKDYRYAGTDMPMYISYDACEGVYDYDTIIAKETTKKVDKGIGTAACSEIVYKIDGSYDEFRATLGFDVYTMGNSKRPSSVQFKVLGSRENDISTEYEELYDSGVVYNSGSGDERPYFVPQDIAVNVKDYKYLKLWVYDAGETGKGGTNPTNESDDVNWAFARLIKKGGETEEGYTYLSDMDQKDASGNPVKNDTDYAGNEIVVNGQNYTKGLGMMADASVSYALGGGYEYFTAEIGFAPGSGVSETECIVYGINSTGGRDVITEVTLSGEKQYQSIGGPISGIETLELVINGNGDENICINWGDAKLRKAEEIIPVELSSITVDGKKLEGFSPSLTEYTVEVDGERVPTIGASAAEELTVKITQPDSVPGDGVITVSDGETDCVYTIHFVPKAETGITVDLLADKKELNPAKDPDGKAELSIKAYDKDGAEIEIPTDAKIEYTAEDLYKSGDVTVAEVDADGIVTPGAGGVSRITVNVTFGGNTYSDTVNITVRPFYNDYHQSMVMKMFLGQDGKINLTLDEALEVVKKIDNMTLGIPKIFYLVGWQYEGHDSGYPSFAKVNEGLKREEDASARDSLIWFMEEAKKYNTTISLHINILDASPESPLWEEYLEKDLIARNADGTLKEYVWGYPISYTAEWNAGLTQRRIDELLELLPPLKEAGTIHIDAFHTVIPNYTDEPISPYHAEKYGYTSEVEEETQRKIFQYFHDKGIDVTSEFVSSYRNDKFIGLQPMAWHFSTLSTTEYLEIPASLYCGGDRGKAVFGENMAGESIIKADKENLTGFMSDFALKTVPFYFLNRFDRLSYEKSGGVETAVFSDGVVSWKNADGSLHITQDGIVLRDGTDVFMPALWNEDEYKEIFAYSKSGYENKTWTLPEQCADIESVDIYNINLTDITVAAQNQPVIDGKITLSLEADQAVAIVPAGTILDPEALEKLGAFQLISPENEAKNQTEPIQLSWTEALNAENYTVTVAADSEFKNIVAEETVSGTSYNIEGLEGNTVYYWKVAAKRYQDGALYESRDNSNGVWSFKTEPSEVPAAPENLSAIRGEKGVRLTWSKSDGADSYNIYRSDGSGFVLVAENIAENSWIDTEASADTAYSYYVCAENGRGESEPGRTVKETANETVYLSDIDWEWAYASARGVMYGDEENIQNTAKPKKDFRYDGSNIKMYISMDPCYNEYNYDNILEKESTIAVDKGIGAAASSEIVYKLDGKYETFVATPAFDIYTLTNKNRVSSAQFKILGSRDEDRSGDYEVLYDSGIIYNSDKDASRPYYIPKEISVSVKEYKYLKLWVSDVNEATAGSPVNASDSLDWAFARLTVAEEPEEVSKKTLEYFLNSAKEHLADGDADDAVESVQKLLEEAIAEGEAVMANESATREEVMNATVKLMKAIQALDMKAGDKTDLEMAVELGDMIDLSKYVETGKKEFTDALSAAKDVLADGDAMQEDIDSAWSALVDALDNLRLKANKDALEDLLNEVSGLDLSRYTEESAETLRQAFARANAVMADETLSTDDQDTVDEAVSALQSAVDGLVVKTDDTGDGGQTGGSDDGNTSGGGQNGGSQNNNGQSGSSQNSVIASGSADKSSVSGSKAVKTGDTAAVGIFLAAALASGAAVLALKKKKR